MTEQEWLNSTHPLEMVDSLTRQQRTFRRAFLFGSACCRRIWPLLPNEPSRRAVEVAELFIDGLITVKDAIKAGHEIKEAIPIALPSRYAARAAYALSGGDMHSPHGIWNACRYAALAFEGNAVAVANPGAYQQLALDAWSGLVEENEMPVAEGLAEMAAAAALLRDIIFNPFQSVPIIEQNWLTWNGGIVKRLAEAIYEERSLPSGRLDNNRLAVLADALEDAGCIDTSLLGHLRDLGPHYRGAWGVDLILGKE